MKSLFCVLLLASAIFLSSCANKDYADDVKCANIIASVEEILPDTQEYEVFGEEHIKYNFERTETKDDACILYSADSTDINEIGIFHAASESFVAELAEEVENYLQDMRTDQRAFIQSYAPNEISKLDGSRVYVFGNYVVYTILPPHERNDAIEEIEHLLLR